MHALKLALHLLLLVGLCLISPGMFLASAESSSLEASLVEANNDFTFRGQPIHPGLVKEFQNWESDYRPPITVAVDVGAAYDTNEYADAVTPRKDGNVSVITGKKGERFRYRRIGRLTNGVHVLYVQDKPAGTGLFQSITFVQFHISQGFDRDGIKPSERLLMSVARVYTIVGTKTPDIQIKGNNVQINSNSQVIHLTFDN